MMWYRLRKRKSLRIVKPHRLGVVLLLLLAGGGLLLSQFAPLFSDITTKADPANPGDANVINPSTSAACNNQSECFAFTVDTRLTSTGATTGTEKTFSIPLSGYVGGAFSNAYSWRINWGDGTATQDFHGNGGQTSAGITHTYATAGQYRIAIRWYCYCPPNTACPCTPNPSGWLNAFGFYSNTDGANSNANKYKLRSIDTPFTDNMREKGANRRFAVMFYGAVNALGIPTGLFANISTTAADGMGGTSLYGEVSHMFYYTFVQFAANSTTAIIPTNLFSTIVTTGATNLTYMFSNTFNRYAEKSTVGTIPAGLFSTINTSSATNLSYMFRGTFSYYAQDSTVSTIPAGLFSTINTSNATNFSRMFQATFECHAEYSTVATIPAGLFASINTNKATDLAYTFNNTFIDYAYSSTSGTVPAGLFSSITIPSTATTLTNVFSNTFSGYTRRQAKFVVNGSAVSTQTFNSPYSVKIGASGTPSDNPTVAAGNVVYPTYNATTRTITAPTGTYANYRWSYKDGTSCTASSPTPDCGAQTSATIATIPNATEWVPTTSTEKGNITFYADATNPTVSATNSSTTWYNADRTAVVSVSDNAAVSGVRYSVGSTNPFTSLSTCQTSGTATSNGASLTISTVGGTTLYLCAYDASGNYATWSGTYRIDKTNPTASATNSGSTWYNADRSAVISAADTGGSALLSVRYSVGPNPFTSYATCGTGGTATSNGASLTISTTVGTTLYVCARDNAGNYYVWSGTYNIDKTNPTASATNASTTWYNADRTATISAADSGGSALLSVRYSVGSNPFTSYATCGSGGTSTSNGASVTVSTVGGTTMYVCSRDNAGNYYVWSGTYNIDKTQPTCGTWTPNATQYSKTNTAIAFTLASSTDTGGSGINTAGGTVNITPTTAGATGSVTISDVAGNTRVCTSPSAILDATAPSLSITNSSTTWYNSDRTSTITSSDASSGLAQIRYNFGSASAMNTDCTTGGTVITSGSATTNATVGGTSLYVCARDNVGNVATTTGTFRVDKTVPTITISPTSGTAAKTHSVTITTADTGGAGLSSSNSYQYQLSTSNSAAPTGTWTTYTSGTAVTLGSSLSGTYYLWVKQIADSAGNVSAATTSTYTVAGTYVFDNTNPTVSATNSGSGWYNANRTAVVTATDTNFSGVRYSTAATNPFTSLATCQASGTATSHNASLSITATSTLWLCAYDTAGNYATWSGTYNIDKTNPTLSLSPTSGNGSTSGISVTLTAADTGGSALAGLRYQETNSTTNPFTSLSTCQSSGTSTTTGSSVTVNTVGTRYVYACAYDNAGNYLTAMGTYTIYALPTVTAVSPAKGLTDTTGTVVTITGTNFTGATAVTVGGTACTSVTVNSATSISCTLPSFSTAGTKSILVTTPGGTNSANTLYTVVAQYAAVSATSLDLGAVSPGKLSSGKSTVTASTNVPGGYQLYMSASSSNLTHATPTFAIPTLSGSTAASPTSAATTSGLIGTASFWGYRVNGLGSFGSTTSQETNATSTAYSWATVPTTNTTIKTGTTTDNLTTNTPQTTDVWFGVSPRLNQAGGSYAVTITYTVIAGV